MLPKGDTKTGEVKVTDVKTHMERNVQTSAYLRIQIHAHYNLRLTYCRLDKIFTTSDFFFVHICVCVVFFFFIFPFNMFRV